MIVIGKNGRKRSYTTFDEALDTVDRIRENLTPDEKELAKILGDEELENQELIREGLFGHVYHTIPVPMEQFLEDPYFLGESCSTLYPVLKEDLVELFERPYREAVFTGGIGVGKTFMLSIAICRILYELSCMISPQKTFGLSSGSEMVIPLVSKNLTLAREIMKTAVDDKIKESPYFMTKFCPNIKKEYTLFPHNIRMTIGSYGSDRILGSNVFTAALDETNYPPKRKGQQISTAFGQKVKAAHFDIVEKIYRGLLRRIKSRFQKAGGGFPGMVILASSAATTESFMERKLRDSREDSGVFVRDHTQWTAKPDTEFCGEYFYVLCSTSATKSRILREDEYDSITDEYLEANDAFIMDIPIEFHDDFESNMEGSLRDIAGFATEAISQFVQRPKMITACIRTDIIHPFNREEWVAGGPGTMNWDSLVVEIERKLPGGFTERAFMPRRNPSAMRWCHVDTSTSGDSSGLAIGHIDRWVEVVKRDIEGNAHVDQAPYYIVDFMLRINPPPAEQIYMPDIRVMIYDFMIHGFKFIGFSSDTYQHVEMHQQVSRKGIKPHIISMDTSTEPYDELKSAFYENRIEIYYYKPFIEEFKKLEYDRIVGKIDHPLAGSKDVSDSVAGVIHGLKTSASMMPLQGRAAKSSIANHEYSWLTPLIPADKVDIDDVNAAKEGISREDFLPILFGD
jgi:hypothetical protein